MVEAAADPDDSTTINTSMTTTTAAEEESVGGSSVGGMTNLSMEPVASLMSPLDTSGGSDSTSDDSCAASPATALVNGTQAGGNTGGNGDMGEGGEDVSVLGSVMGSVMGGEGEEVSVMPLLGSMATSLSSFDSQGSLSTIESTASMVPPPTPPLTQQYRPSTLGPASLPPPGPTPASDPPASEQKKEASATPPKPSTAPPPPASAKPPPVPPPSSATGPSATLSSSSFPKPPSDTMGGRKADELEGSGSSVGSGPVVVTEFYSYDQLVERKRDGRLDGIHPTALEVSQPSSCETVLTSH